MANNITVTPENGAYRVEFPYNPRMVEAIKSTIPSTGRSWDGTRKCWMVAAQYRREGERALGMTFPDMAASKPVIETRLLEVHYIGQCKERAPGDISAMGMDAKGNWAVVFPMNTLTGWFDGGYHTQTNQLTLYSVLGASQSATDDEIKTAYRRMVKQWHPDVCHETNAHEMFLRIRKAYDMLSNPRNRDRYDAGLKLVASLEKKPVRATDIYRSPLRCGFIMAEGAQVLGRFVVFRVLAWEDIVNQSGQTLVVSWPLGADEPQKVWA